MKVEKSRQFQPIVITLESEEEAYELWFRLNLPVARVQNAMSAYTPTDAIYPMWQSFDAVYRPNDVRPSEAPSRNSGEGEPTCGNRDS